MSDLDPPNRRSRLMDFIPRKRTSSASHQLLNYPDSPGPAPSLDYSSNTHGSGNSFGDSLEPPTRPYADSPGVGGENRMGSRKSSYLSIKSRPPSLKERPTSLSVNYVPAKFSKLHAPGEWSHRKKMGAGRDAFAKDAQRMGMMGTVDDDEGVVFQLGKGGLKKKKPKLRWNRFKWVLFIANAVLIIYGLAALIGAILVWLNVFYQSDVVRVGNRTELILSTVAASLCILTALMGYMGILLNNRAFLAVYTLMLWICLAFIVAPGYLTYKQRTFNLEGKINAQWSRDLGAGGRLRIQDALRCCGYYSPYVEATVSPLCYPRSIEPGCKARYLKFERYVLETWYTISFSLVPAHILIIIGSLLSSNHITYRFGKGLTPKRYRLDLGSMAVIMDEYASQIAAQYGEHIAIEARNRSSVVLDQSQSPFEDQPIRTRAESFMSVANSTGTQAGLTQVSSRPSYHAQHSSYDSLDPQRGGLGVGGEYAYPQSGSIRPRSGLINEYERYEDSDEGNFQDDSGGRGGGGLAVGSRQSGLSNQRRSNLGWGS